VTQDEVLINGHSIECRVNAENPVTFRPSPARSCNTIRPAASGCGSIPPSTQGYVIPPYYDSLVGKLIVHGKTRAECLMRLRRALDECGGRHRDHAAAVQWPGREPDIIDGDYHIHWLEQYLAGKAGG